jgi:hypothetical protein
MKGCAAVVMLRRDLARRCTLKGNEEESFVAYKTTSHFN